MKKRIKETHKKIEYRNPLNGGIPRRGGGVPTNRSITRIIGGHPPVKRIG